MTLKEYEILTKIHRIRERLWRPSPFSVAGELVPDCALYTNIQHTQTRTQEAAYFTFGASHLPESCREGIKCTIRRFWPAFVAFSVHFLAFGKD